VKGFRAAIVWAAMASAAFVTAAPGEAHKPITSPFTFSEHVKPIVEAQCGGCHAPGGVAPMSLLTHADAVPWSESIRAEVLSGHMPPWPVDTAPARFRNAQVLTAREMDVLLTWVAGGTPPGAAPDLRAAGPESAGSSTQWPLGAPDLVLPLPREHTLAAGIQEEMVEFVVATGTRETRWVRAVDVQPGTPAIVRAATVAIRDPAASRPGVAAPEPVLALWLPGEEPVRLDGSTAFLLPASAELVVRIQYRKTWEYERQEVRDRSVVGVYFNSAPGPELRALPLEGASTDAAAVRFSRTIEADVTALAIYPDAGLDGLHVTVSAARPDGSREELIAFRPRRDWARRYWFAEPVQLPRGTRITVDARPDGTLLPPGALPQPAPTAPAAIRLTLNLIGT
jgi:hypothetical protein